MKRINNFKSLFFCAALLMVMSCATSNTAAVEDTDKSVSEGEVVNIEYKILLNEEKLGFGANNAGEPVLTGKVASLLREKGIEFPPDSEPVKKYYYLYAAPNGDDYREKGLIFRVRQDRVKPAKSKVTIKSRQLDYESLDFKSIQKIDYEFDAGASGKPVDDRSGISHYYNTAYDVSYVPEKDFTAEGGELEFAGVWKWLDEKHYWLRHMLKQNYPSLPDSEFPGVVDAYKFEGKYSGKDKPFLENIEYTIDYWVLEKEGKSQKLAEISFKNEEELTLESKKAFDNYYLELYRELYEAGYVNKNQSSKTGIYFRFFGK